MAPELSDGVVRLVALTDDDVPALVAGDDDEIARRLVRGRSTADSARRLVRARAADWAGEWSRPGATLTWGIRDAGTATLAGTAEVQLRHPDLAAGSANLVHAVFPAWRGRGFATRAVGLVCAFLAQRTAVATAVLRVEPDNAASLRVAAASGFRPSPELAPERASLLWFRRDLTDG